MAQQSGTTALAARNARGQQSIRHDIVRTHKPCILVVHASVGSGHRSAALAIEEALITLKQRHDPRLGPDCDIEVLDILDFGRIRFDGDKTASMFTGVTRPFYDITWRYCLTGRALWGGGTVWNRVMFPRFTKYVEERKPLAIIATHITAANCAVGARMITGQAYPIVCVPTDYEVEGLWPHKETDLFCLGTESMAETLRPRKVPEQRLLITGLPVRQGINRAYDVAEIRQRMGIPRNDMMVLVMAGAHLPRPYVRLRETVDLAMEGLSRMEGMHFVFLPGKDAAYTEHLKQRQEELSFKNMTVMGYVTDMPELMAAGDLAICKSGGLTVTECINARLPMLIVGRSYGQEKVNTRMLTNLGAAMHVTTAREMVDALRHLRNNPSSLRSMLVNGEVLRRPNASMAIASATLDLVGADCSTKKRFIRGYWGRKPAHAR